MEGMKPSMEASTGASMPSTASTEASIFSYIKVGNPVGWRVGRKLPGMCLVLLKPVARSQAGQFYRAAVFEFYLSPSFLRYFGWTQYND